MNTAAEPQLTDLQREAMEEQARRRAEEKYRYYEPNGKIEEFINMVGDLDVFVAYCSAANGVGKTRAGVNIVAHTIWPVGNKYFKSKMFTEPWPFPKNGLIVSNHATVENTVIREILDQFPKGKYRTDKLGKQYISKITTNNGWNIDIMTYDQSIDAFESSTRGFAWFDEPPPENIFKATVARMRKGGVIFITATPINMTAAWLVEKIIEKPMDEIKEHGKTGFVEADVESACIEHGVRGHLKHEDILNMISQYDDEDIQARVFGKSRALIGRVIKYWNREVHFVEPFTINKRDFVVAEYVDTHPRTPDVVLYVAIDRFGRHFAVNELEVDGDDDMLAEEIKRVRQLYNYRIISSKIEPAAFNVDKHTGYSLGVYLSTKHGLDFEPANKNREYNNRQLREGFRYQMTQGQMVMPPQWYVFNTLKRFPWEIEHWQWDDWRGKTSEYRGVKQKPMDKNDHFIECAARIAGDHITWTPYVEKVAPHVAPRLDPYYGNVPANHDNLDPY